ncbi:ribosome biogenesis protein Nop16 [Dictyocaulus viviparus]|uniref:Nucleolar protein 16 n=1 Tax=Dictyocaulus viviparus TaxID=29172 RepID=A0A0D8XV12_DICVI|nr:ribosome biogenesis protein Nop16 [Dictyocaulus viviparus]
MVKKKGKKFRPNLKQVARKRRILEKKKKKCRSAIKVIKENWEGNKTPRENLMSMGLAFNANEAVPVKQPRREIIDMLPIEGLDLEEARVLGTVAEQRLKKQKRKKLLLQQKSKKSCESIRKFKALKVISCLESEVAEEQSLRDANVRTVRLPDRDVELLIYLAERYGEDYEAMARDPKNLFQYTPKKICSLMKIYRTSGFHKVIEGMC